MRVLIKDVRCRKCGTAVDPLCKYCPVCGTNLEEAFIITIADILKNLQDEIEAKLRMIEEREEALANREMELERKEREYRERLERVYEKERELEGREMRLEEKEMNLMLRYEEIIRKEKELNEREHKLLAREKEIVGMLAEIGKSGENYIEIGKKLKMLDEMLEEHEAELRKLEAERQKIIEMEKGLFGKMEEREEKECRICGSLNSARSKKCKVCGAEL